MVKRTPPMMDRMAGSPGAPAGEFPGLIRTERGRIIHCPEAGRFLVGFQGAWLVLRHGEFLRLQAHLRAIAACSWTRSRFAGGERIELQDSTREKTLVLDWAALQELVGLLDAGARRLDSPGSPLPARDPSLNQPLKE